MNTDDLHASPLPPRKNAGRRNRLLPALCCASAGILCLLALLIQPSPGQAGEDPDSFDLQLFGITLPMPSDWYLYPRSHNESTLPGAFINLNLVADRSFAPRPEEGGMIAIDAARISEADNANLDGVIQMMRQQFQQNPAVLGYQYFESEHNGVRFHGFNNVLAVAQNRYDYHRTLITCLEVPYAGRTAWVLYYIRFSGSCDANGKLICPKKYLDRFDDYLSRVELQPGAVCTVAKSAGGVPWQKPAPKPTTSVTDPDSGNRISIASSGKYVEAKDEDGEIVWRREFDNGAATGVLMHEYGVAVIPRGEVFNPATGELTARLPE